MSAIVMRRRLVASIQADPVLMASGIVPRSLPGGILAIERDGRVAGTWQWRHGSFALTVAGYNEPSLTVETVGEAVLETRRILSR